MFDSGAKLRACADVLIIHGNAACWQHTVCIGIDRAQQAIAASVPCGMDCLQVCCRAEWRGLAPQVLAKGQTLLVLVFECMLHHWPCVTEQ
jgi:hypothetical protein